MRVCVSDLVMKCHSSKNQVYYWKTDFMRSVGIYTTVISIEAMCPVNTVKSVLQFLHELHVIFSYAASVIHLAMTLLAVATHCMLLKVCCVTIVSCVHMYKKQNCVQGLCVFHSCSLFFCDSIISIGSFLCGLFCSEFCC